MSKEDKLDYSFTYGDSITLDGSSFSSFEDGDTITVTNTSNNNGPYVISDMTQTSFTIRDIYQEQIDEINEKFDKIMERLAILDEPDSDQLEKNRALKKAYDHYKFVEALAGAKKKDG